MVRDYGSPTIVRYLLRSSWVTSRQAAAPGGRRDDDRGRKISSKDNGDWPLKRPPARPHLTWGIDSNHDLRRGKNFTLQWSLYAEALNHSLHEKGAHAMLASFRDLTGNISIHHNLFASSRERHPTWPAARRRGPA